MNLKDLKKTVKFHFENQKIKFQWGLIATGGAPGSDGLGLANLGCICGKVCKHIHIDDSHRWKS